MRLGFHGSTLKVFGGGPSRLSDQGCRWKFEDAGDGKFSITNMYPQSAGMRIGFSGNNMMMFELSRLSDGGFRWALEEECVT